jgi:hypothetical protein
MQNKAVFYFHFDVFIFDNKVAGVKMQLDWQFAWCPAAVECPALYAYPIKLCSLLNIVS